MQDFQMAMQGVCFERLAENGIRRLFPQELDFESVLIGPKERSHTISVGLDIHCDRRGTYVEIESSGEIRVAVKVEVHLRYLAYFLRLNDAFPAAEPIPDHGTVRMAEVPEALIRIEPDPPLPIGAVRLACNVTGIEPGKTDNDTMALDALIDWGTVVASVDAFAVLVSLADYMADKIRHLIAGRFGAKWLADIIDAIKEFAAIVVGEVLQGVALAERIVDAVLYRVQDILLDFLRVGGQEGRLTIGKLRRRIPLAKARTVTDGSVLPPVEAAFAGFTFAVRTDCRRQRGIWSERTPEVWLDVAVLDPSAPS